MNSYRLISYYEVSSIVMEKPNSVQNFSIGTVPLLNKTEYLLASIGEIDKAFREMTDILKRRDKTVWPKSN